MVNPRKYSGFHRGVGDESNKPVLEILVPGELTETYSRVLHIAQADDANAEEQVRALSGLLQQLKAGEITLDEITVTGTSQPAEED